MSILIPQSHPMSTCLKWSQVDMREAFKQFRLPNHGYMLSGWDNGIPISEAPCFRFPCHVFGCVRVMLLALPGADEAGARVHHAPVVGADHLAGLQAQRRIARTLLTGSKASWRRVQRVVTNGVSGGTNSIGVAGQESLELVKWDNAACGWAVGFGSTCLFCDL